MTPMTAIFWNIDMCPLPGNLLESVYSKDLVEKFHQGLESAGIKCSAPENINLFVYGDFGSYPHFTEALNLLPGVTIHHRHNLNMYLGSIPLDIGTNDRYLAVEMLTWANLVEPGVPASIVLITGGNSDLSIAISRLYLENFTIVVACKFKLTSSWVDIFTHVTLDFDYLACGEARCFDNNREKHLREKFTMVRDMHSNDPHIYVWWDHSTCNVPSGSYRDIPSIGNMYMKIPIQMRRALRSKEMCGRIKIFFYGDFEGDTTEKSAKVTAFQNANVCLRQQMTQGNKYNMGLSMTNEIMQWWPNLRSANSILVIISDLDFRAIEKMLEDNQRLIVVRNKEATIPYGEAISMWSWPQFLEGEILSIIQD